MANTQIFTAQRDHRAGTEAEALSPEDGRFDDIKAGFQTAVHLQTNFVAQPVGNQRLLGFHQSQFPRTTRILHGRERAGAGAAVVAGNGDQIRIGFGYAGGDSPDARFRNQLHGDHRFRVNLLQVENQLSQILDRVNIVVRRRGDQRYAGYGIAQLGDIGGDFITRQLAAFAGLRALSDFNLNNVGVNQVSRGHAEAAGGDLLDARDFIGAVACRIFAAFAGVGVTADAVHCFRQRFVRFRAQRADRHRRGIEAFEQFAGRLNVVQVHRGSVRRYAQQIAQRCRRALINQLRVLLVIAVFAALYRLLQRAHHVRVIGVIFAAVDVFQQAALIQRFTRQPGTFRQVQQILLEILEARAADTADDALEAQVGHFAMQTDRLK